MKFGSTALLRSLVFMAVVLHSAIADLNSDKQALLDFAASVPHRRNLRWDPATPVCSSWLGVTCTDDNDRVLSLRLPGVGLVGLIPAQTLGKLDGLEALSLRSNLLSGNLPADIASLPKLRLLYLQHNNFSGEIPSSLSPALNVLDLSFNSFAGEIPGTLKNLTDLTGLNLVNNSLAGPIPELGPGLKHLNLSYNNLNGSVPPALRKFPGSSFVGNSALCGPPLGACSSITSVLPPSSDHVMPAIPRNEDRKRKLKLPRWAVIAIAAGASTLLLGLAVLLVLCCCLCKKKKGEEGAAEKKKKAKSIGAGGEKPREGFGSGVQEAEKNKLVFFEGCSFNFDLEDLLRASAEVLGKGSYGTAYKAILEEATTVVVKRLKEVVVTKKDFDHHMETVGRVGHHPNVVPLRAYYYSKDEKLLVYDYVPRGSLSALLHGNRGGGRTALDWETRVKIALHTAKGLAHIHRMGGPKFSHGNVKATNVLLLPDNGACVSDFGLSPLMTAAATSSSSSSSAVAGYRAPEVVEARKYSHKSDVYSFGVLVLEMLTGKAPQMSPGRDDAAAVDLPRWVQSVVREEWTAEVFDVELMRYNDIEEEMVQMLQIAMACVAKLPDSRPTMDEVVRMIDDIRHNDSDNRPSSEENVKSKDSNPHTP